MQNRGYEKSKKELKNIMQMRVLSVSSCLLGRVLFAIVIQLAAWKEETFCLLASQFQNKIHHAVHSVGLETNNKEILHR